MSFWLISRPDAAKARSSECEAKSIEIIKSEHKEKHE